jgi:protoporphyrinogen oxidase
VNAEGIVILGAGLAGAGAARHLPGARVFEAETEPGGYARSHEFAGAWFDCGAHICHSSDETWLSLVAGHAPLHVMAESRVLNFKAGRWFSYPVQNHLYELPEEERKAALAGFLEAQEKYRGREPENYEEWCRFQYGDFLLENFYRLYTAKYWHRPMQELATDWLGGRLLPGQVETILAGAVGKRPETQAVFKRFRYPENGGFFALVAHLFEGLPVAYGKKAVELDLAARTVAFADGSKADYDELVSTIPLPALVRMAKDAPPSVREAAGKLQALRHFCVNFVVEREKLSPAQWFYVYDPGIPVSRVSFPFSLSGKETGRTAVQAEVMFPGGARPDEGALLERTLSDMGRILDFRPGEIAAAEIRCHPVSYVVSDLERAPAVAHVREWLERNHVRTAGLFGNWAYIWSDRAYASGAATAAKLAGGGK